MYYVFFEDTEEVKMEKLENLRFVKWFLSPIFYQNMLARIVPLASRTVSRSVISSVVTCIIPILHVNPVAHFGSCSTGEESTNFNDRLINKNMNVRDVIYLDAGVFNVDAFL